MQPYPNGAAPVRYMVPPGYRQPYPPFVNRSFDRFAVVPTTFRAPRMARPVNYPPMYGPGYNQGGPPNQPGANQSTATAPGPTVTGPRPTTQSQKQPHYFNPNGAKNKSAMSTVSESRTSVTKKGAKEFKDTAFTIDADGTQNNSIRGLVSNDDINNLLKHKGTKVKVSKIYRITKTKPEVLSDSEDEAPPPPPPPKATAQRPASADSYCSECAAGERSTHVYDDCPLCRAQQQQQQQVHVYDDCPECRAQLQRQSHGYDDCAECRAERNRQLSRR